MTPATRDRPSPNHGDRRGMRPDMVVLHYTAMASAAAALDRLCDPAAEVSAHYLIEDDGRVWSLVPEDRRAWHAGAGAWGGAGDVNSRSVGIELANSGDRPFAALQMAALRGLLRGVMHRWAIPPARVIGHACMAPRRKDDPGPRFDWRALATEGLSVWIDAPAGTGPRCEAAAFRVAAARFGYPIGAAGGWDGDALSVARAFRERFRPWDRGPGLSVPGLDHLRGLAARWPAG
jgi:N-acetylmuramoyl-L-alanine amidase